MFEAEDHCANVQS